MGTTAAFVIYFVGTVALIGALYTWRDLSLGPLRTKLRSAVAKLQVIAAERERQLLAADAERLNERQQWTAEFQRAREHIDHLRQELAEVRSGSLARWTAFRHMKQVWGDNDEPMNEAAAKELLRENMWVLEPEYRVMAERVDWEVNLTNALKTLYGTFAAIDTRVWKTPPDLAQLVDIAAVVSMDGTLGSPRTHAGDEALLLIEAKRPGRNGVLNEAARDQVLSYAADLRKIAPDILMGRRIECLLIGGRIPDRMNDIVVKWDSEGEAPTMVRLLTWETLLTRAERACELSGPRPGSAARLHEPTALAAQ